MGLINQSEKDYYQGADGTQLNGDGNYGFYQFTSLNDIIAQFMVVYVGEDKLIRNANRTDVAFHAQRGLAELSFDTLKSVKAFEYIVPASLKMPVPQDYVNYVKLSWIDTAGIKHIIYPTSKTSNASSYQQNADGSFVFEENNYQKDVDSTFNDYGITQSGQRSHKDGSGNLKSKNLLPNFEKEIRIAMGLFPSYKVAYGPGSGQQINFFDTHAIEVGMTIFAPGIPLNSTVATVGASTSGSYPGMGITFTNPLYEQHLLNGSTADLYPGQPSHVQVGGEEIIFVDLNKKSSIQSSYKSATPAENNNDDYEDDTYWPMDGSRYGLDPQHAQVNGSYYIDTATGLIHFSSNISGKTVILDYISDSLGTDGEMQVHKFAEEAIYKWISYGILSGKANIPEYQVNRFKKERFAAVRTAKLRLSNLKLEELTQILRGKSKQIKH